MWSISSIEIKRGLIQNNVYYTFSSAHKPSDVAAAANLFSSVYVHGMTCFDEYFSFYVITRRHYFL